MVPEMVPVKEREEADCCRYCGRPTWSLRRCCVRCKRAGRSGAGEFASWHAAGARRGPALLGFWLGHVGTVVAAGAVLLSIDNAPPPVWGFLAQLAFCETTLCTLGFGIALLSTARPPRSAAPALVRLSVVAGVVCAVVVNELLLLLWRFADNPLSPGYLLVLIVLLSANVGRIVLAVGSPSIAADGSDHHPPNAP